MHSMGTTVQPPLERMHAPLLITMLARALEGITQVQTGTQLARAIFRVRAGYSYFSVPARLPAYLSAYLFSFLL